jgi:hypothetical protein
MPRIRGLVLVVAAGVLLGVTSGASAAPILDINPTTNGLTFSGTFDVDNAFIAIPFSILTPSEFVAVTDSYGEIGEPEPGGVRGGFDPMLHLFDAAGQLVNIPQSDGSVLPAFNDDAVPFTDDDHPNIIRDSLIEIPSLAVGDYTLVLTQWSNFPIYSAFEPFRGLVSQDSPIYACPVDDIGQPLDPSCSGFIDSDLVQRTNAFGGSLTIKPLEQPVPEPGTLALLATGVGWLASRRGLRRKAGVQARDS